MTRRHIVLVLLAGLLSPGLVSRTAYDELADLKKRFEARHPAMQRLRDAGKIGETWTGLALVVKAEFAGEKVDPKDPRSPTVGDFLKLENTDRERLYVLLAKQLREKPETIAQQNALRNFDKASPEHLWQDLDKDGKLVWKKRKDVKRK